MSWVWDHSPYDRTQLLIHLALADWASDEGWCWPAQNTIAKKCKCTDRYVQETVADMRDKGYIHTIRRFRTSNLYRLIDPTSGGTYPEPQFGTDPNPPSGGSRTPTVHEPSIEPSTIPTLPDPADQVLEEADLEELEYVSVEEEEAEHSGWSRPKWQLIPANHMKYAANWRRKYFRSKKERSDTKSVFNSITAGLVSSEWVDKCQEWGLTSRSDQDRRPRWSYSGFLRAALDQEKYRDWEIRRANAERSGADALPDGTDLDSIDTYFSP